MTSSAVGARPHAGAALFAEGARRLVAEGDPFDVREGSFYVRMSDRRDLIAALLFAAGLADTPIAGPVYAARHLGVDVGRYPYDRRIKALGELAEINDHGGYADVGHLRLALLGEAG